MSREQRKANLDAGYDYLEKIALGLLKKAARLRKLNTPEDDKEALGLEKLARQYMNDVRQWYTATKPAKGQDGTPGERWNGIAATIKSDSSEGSGDAGDDTGLSAPTAH